MLKEKPTETEAQSYRTPMPVTTLQRYKSYPKLYTFPLCPRCKGMMEYEYQAFCEYCGQALSWKNLSKAIVISI